jgi:uncharacterized protein YxjI
LVDIQRDKLQAGRDFYCSNCRSTIARGLRFCENCGRQVKIGTAALVDQTFIGSKFVIQSNHGKSTFLSPRFDIKDEKGNLVAYAFEIIHFLKGPRLMEARLAFDSAEGTRLGELEGTDVAFRIYDALGRPLVTVSKKMSLGSFITPAWGVFDSSGREFAGIYGRGGRYARFIIALGTGMREARKNLVARIKREDVIMLRPTYSVEIMNRNISPYIVLASTIPLAQPFTAA